MMSSLWYSIAEFGVVSTPVLIPPMDVRTRGTEGMCLIFHRFVCKVPHSAYMVPFLHVKMSLNACVPTS